MSLVHNASFGESVLVRMANEPSNCLRGLRHGRLGIGVGLGLSALMGLPFSVAPVGLAGLVIATLASGKLGGRAAAAVGFVTYLVVNRPGASAAMAFAALSVFLGWAVPAAVEWIEGRSRKNDGSAVVIDGEGFGVLDRIYGAGSSSHAFDLLKRAVELETLGADAVVHVDGRQLTLAFDESDPSAADLLMTRIERRFAGWLSDAGYECNLVIGSQGSDVLQDCVTLR